MSLIQIGIGDPQMKTMIRSGDVIGYDGREHRIIRDGVVVIEDDRIIHVGKQYEGYVDTVINAGGRLVSPGFINIHAWAIIDVPLRLDSSWEVLTVSKASALYQDPSLDVPDADLGFGALFGLAALLRGGSTTSVTLTAMAGSQWEAPPEQARIIARTAGELGARAYVSHQYRSAVRYRTAKGELREQWNEDAAQAGLTTAVRFAEEFDGAYEGRIRTMLFPYHFDSCSPGLLEQTKEAARDKDLIVHLHAAESSSEFQMTVQEHGVTPVQVLYDIGFLDPRTIVTHVTHTSASPVTGYGGGRDLELLAESGATVAHCPVVYSRLGQFLHSFGRYLDAGINVGIGTDEYPTDMIREMHCAAIMGKVADQNALAVTAREVFDAATLGGARALGRDDLGRLAPGSKADVVIVDLTGLHTALIDDPIQALVYAAGQRDIETVIVDGKLVVQEGRLMGVDEEQMVRNAKELIRRQTEAFVDQNPMGLTADRLCPRSFPVDG